MADVVVGILVLSVLRGETPVGVRLCDALEKVDEEPPLSVASEMEDDVGDAGLFIAAMLTYEPRGVDRGVALGVGGVETTSALPIDHSGVVRDECAPQ